MKVAAGQSAREEVIEEKDVSSSVTLSNSDDNTMRFFLSQPAVSDAVKKALTQALEHAKKACELSGWKNPYYLDTLAAAYAISGDFDAAVLWQLKALESPEAFSKDERAEVKFRLRLYEKGKPYRAE